MDFAFLFFAGVIAGVVNSLAGGGSLITFPALMAVGVPPLVANATNTYASCAGYISGIYGFRHHLRQHHQLLFTITLFSLAGGVTGAWLLLNTDESVFEFAIPWLMLFATLAFAFGGSINQFINRFFQNRSQRTLPPILIIISIYGGFFNAGLGIVALSYLALAGYQNIHVMNALKLVISTAVSIIAVFIFTASGHIDWHSGSVVLIGSVVGGYVSARVAHKIPQASLKAGILLLSVSVTTYYFVKISLV